MRRLKDILKENLFSILKVMAILIMLVIVGLSIGKELKSINLAETLMLIKSFSFTKIMFLIVIGLAAISSITLYDFIIIRYFKLDIKSIAIFTVSYVATTINNVSPLGNVAGASIRSIFFKKDDDNTDVLDYNLLFLPSTGIGLSIFLLICLFRYKYILPLINEYKFLIYAVIGFLGYLIVYFFIDKIFYTLKKKDVKINNKDRNIVKLKLLISSLFQWLLAYALFSIIIKNFNHEISLMAILGIYTLGCMAGIITMLPGGVGSFDLISLFGFQYYGLPSENILAALVLYRVFYYIIPLLVSIIFTLIVQVQNKNSAVRIFNGERFKVLVNRTSNFTNFLLSILIFFSGVVLLVSALLPGMAERVKFISRILSFPILQWSHQISICIGILLITVSRDISMKVKRSYNLTLWLLLLGAIFTFLKGFDYEEAVFLGVVFILLRASKGSFFRESLPLDWFRLLTSSFIALIGIFIYMRLSHKIHFDFLTINGLKGIFDHGFSVVFKPSGLVTYGSFIIYLVMKEITKKKIVDDERYEDIDEDRLSKFLGEYKGGYSTHLCYLQDKHIFWSNTGKVGIAFEKSHNFVIVLGDPFGDKEYFGYAIDEFHRFIDEYGYKSFFYEASNNLLDLYHEHGYYFFKLGEIGLVDLEEFDITSSKSRDHRNLLSRFSRDGYRFEMNIQDKIDNKLYNDILETSTQWLKGRNEMGFSMGFMNREYIEKSPLALIREVDTNEIIAFISLMPKYDDKSISIDLMRFKEDIPKNTMEYLIISLMMELKSEGYKTLSLGMAPLSNVGINQYSHYRERIAHIIYKHGKEIYNFSGLRSFKEKFKPSWEGRYLAYEDLTMLPAAIIEATILIHSKK